MYERGARDCGRVSSPCEKKKPLELKINFALVQAAFWGMRPPPLSGINFTGKKPPGAWPNRL
jgi:hypothetical protein